MKSNARRVLLTGATGFVGSALLPLLLADGWRVRVTSRRPPESETREGLEWARCDVDDLDSVRGDRPPEGGSLAAASFAVDGCAAKPSSRPRNLARIPI